MCCVSVCSVMFGSVTTRTAARQAPLSTAFPRQSHWSRLPFPPPGQSSPPRDWTRVSYIGRWILYHWATREACMWYLIIIYCINKWTHPRKKAFFFLRHFKAERGVKAWRLRVPGWAPEWSAWRSERSKRRPGPRVRPDAVGKARQERAVCLRGLSRVGRGLRTQPHQRHVDLDRSWWGGRLRSVSRTSSGWEGTKIIMVVTRWLEILLALLSSFCLTIYIYIYIYNTSFNVLNVSWF